jgi:hypothetical protein
MELVHYRVHKNTLLVTTLSQMFPIRKFPTCFPNSILTSSYHLRLDLSSDPLASVFQPNDWWIN